jgi:hypothetical protein
MTCQLGLQNYRSEDTSKAPTRCRAYKRLLTPLMLPMAFFNERNLDREVFRIASWHQGTPLAILVLVARSRTHNFGISKSTKRSQIISARTSTFHSSSSKSTRSKLLLFYMNNNSGSLLTLGPSSFQSHHHNAKRQTLHLRQIAGEQEDGPPLCHLRRRCKRVHNPSAQASMLRSGKKLVL